MAVPGGRDVIGYASSISPLDLTTFLKKSKAVNKPIPGKKLPRHQTCGLERPETIQKLSVLFVCKANLCRSPACVGVLTRFLHDAGIADLVTVDSAGILDEYQGKKPAWKMRYAGLRRGFRVAGRARRVNRRELDLPGFVIAMDRSVLCELRRLHSRPECDLHLLSDFLPENFPVDLPDPFGGTLRSHREVLNIIQRACNRILADVLLPRLQVQSWRAEVPTCVSKGLPDHGQLQLGRHAC
jgi:protein-tyrosine phosphatase